ncbi:MAG TPA: hypothetical protein DIT48_12015 [Actinobacteria bacterium]|jgi:hypothetical protein|nr:hypothetical protein [Actinomycetota bacterium]HCP61411.1 hypothetical protein [Actinomycetota bacterium]
MTLRLVFPIMFAVVALADTVLVLVTPRWMQRRMTKDSRQRQEEGYRLDFYRPFLWMLATWPRRVVFSLSTLAFAAWLLWANWPN